MACGKQEEPMAFKAELDAIDFKILRE